MAEPLVVGMFPVRCRRRRSRVVRRKPAPAARRRARRGGVGEVEERIGAAPAADRGEHLHSGVRVFRRGRRLRRCHPPGRWRSRNRPPLPCTGCGRAAGPGPPRRRRVDDVRDAVAAAARRPAAAAVPVGRVDADDLAAAAFELERRAAEQGVGPAARARQPGGGPGRGREQRSNDDQHEAADERILTSSSASWKDVASTNDDSASPRNDPYHYISNWSKRSAAQLGDRHCRVVRRQWLR